MHVERVHDGDQRGMAMRPVLHGAVEGVHAEVELVVPQARRIGAQLVEDLNHLGAVGDGADQGRPEEVTAEHEGLVEITSDAAGESGFE